MNILILILTIEVGISEIQKNSLNNSIIKSGYNSLLENNNPININSNINMKIKIISNINKIIANNNLYKKYFYIYIKDLFLLF